MNALNLLPAYAQPRHPWAAIGNDVSPRRVLAGGAAIACFVGLGLGLGYVHERTVVNDRHATLADVNTQVAAADAKAAPMRAAQAAVVARTARAAAVTSRRIAWETLLADISRVLPSQVYLQSLAVQSPKPFASSVAAPTTTTGTTGFGFSATGVASSHVRVALVLDRLARLPWLSDVTLVSSTSGVSASTSGSLSAGDTFSISAVFDPNGRAK